MTDIIITAVSEIELLFGQNWPSYAASSCHLLKKGNCVCSVVSGKITKYAEGNSALRLLAGFGAGSSHFDADVKISESSSNTELGKIILMKKTGV